ncbi:hypothetical protein EV182_004310 [Spiromyces aspiralis]|uniref:Uncharacterized protein n=1 Tax=Spiromyces aspiralis TaxID=68401 RepID=A0ACC1HCM1_9FUNG|nr:hypothetical protein EV182_004310 [Spiromyces aspiralis]
MGELTVAGLAKTSRLIPIQNTCFVNLEDIVVMAKKLVQPLLEDTFPATTFALAVKVRNCDKLSRDAIIPPIAALLGGKHKVDLKDAEYTIVVEVFKVRVVKDYNKLKRYNLQALTQMNIDKQEQPQ